MKDRISNGDAYKIATAACNTIRELVAALPNGTITNSPLETIGDVIHNILLCNVLVETEKAL